MPQYLTDCIEISGRLMNIGCRRIPQIMKAEMCILLWCRPAELSF